MDEPVVFAPRIGGHKSYTTRAAELRPTLVSCLQAAYHSGKRRRPMKKFLVLYRAPTSGFEQMKKATPEQQKAGMEAWMAWGKKAQASIVDMGAPLGKSTRLAKSGEATPTTNDLGGYSVLQAESKEALAKMLEGHPHFMMPDGFIETIELMPMPGT
jgi:hypothetical protein